MAGIKKRITQNTETDEMTTTTDYDQLNTKLDQILVLVTAIAAAQTSSGSTTIQKGRKPAGKPNSTWFKQAMVKNDDFFKAIFRGTDKELWPYEPVLGLVPATIKEGQDDRDKLRNKFATWVWQKHFDKEHKAHIGNIRRELDPDMVNVKVNTLDELDGSTDESEVTSKRKPPAKPVPKPAAPKAAPKAAALKPAPKPTRGAAKTTAPTRVLDDVSNGEEEEEEDCDE
jgi:hypothetical protein